MRFVNIANFNYVEAALWFLIAIGIFISRNQQGKNSPYRTITTIATIGFVAFGFSDIIEAHTGAWWRPLSLLLLKSVCVIALIGCYYQYLKIKRSINH